MSITSELERLSAIRDRGDLSPAEFEKAKRLLLSDEGAEATPVEEPAPSPAAAHEKKRRTMFLVAILSSVAAALSATSMIINPSPFSVGSLMMWLGLSSYWWVTLTKLKAEVRAARSANPQHN